MAIRLDEVRVHSWKCHYCGRLLRSIHAVKKHMMTSHYERHMADIARQREEARGAL